MQKLVSLLAGLVCGTTIGFAGALLLAPEPGEDLRVQMQQRWATAKEEARMASEAKRDELKTDLARLQRGEQPSNP
jgi:gas vesicle protein